MSADSARAWSVIVPVLNERERLPDFVDHLRDRLAGAEFIFVDGGSQDGTQDWLVQQTDLKWIQTERGRGLQMAEGVNRSQGVNLLFLHVDSTLPQTSLYEMEEIIADTGLGYYRFAINGTEFRYRFMEMMVRVRELFLNLPYGDQGFFMTRQCYERSGGFSPLPLFEDVDLWSRLAERSHRRTDSPLITSDRRIRRRGFWSSCLRNLLLVSLFKCGIRSGKLVRWYV